MDEYGTHLPVLTYFVSKTTGPVLELGSGFFSTPTLNLLCKDRLLVTADSNKEWIRKFYALKNDNHLFFEVDDWSKFDYIDKQWDVAFVDHAPGERRVVDIERLKKTSKYVLVHDSEERGYGYEPTLSKFKYRYDYKFFRTWTTIVSDFCDCGI